MYKEFDFSKAERNPYAKVLNRERNMEASKNMGANELEFAIFCIESVAERLGVSAQKVYDAWCGSADILDGYVIPEYEVLHTQGKEYIVDELIKVMNERSVKL